MYPPHTNPQLSRPTQQGPPPPISIPGQVSQHQNTNVYSMPPNIPPPSPSQSSEANDDSNFNLPGPPPISRIFRDKAWALDIVQQPSRARMCGFGDKDRRPISPPPCVRLIIIDVKTGQEINYSDIADLSKFVLHVDLSSLDTLEEKNLVKHTTSSPSISSVSTTSYPPTMTAASPAQHQLASYSIDKIPAYTSQTFTSPTSTTPLSATGYHSNGNQPPYYGNGVSTYGRPSQYSYNDPRYNSQYGNGYSQMPPQLPPMQHMEPIRSGSTAGMEPRSSNMYTRNLIGSLSSSAFKLQDLEDQVGLWFVFQDLSIRTEGWFRLKMTFFDIGDHESSDDVSTAKLATIAPMLACIYSKPFKVYSAKRFPGVVESTDLSRKFANQGIKIPIRKDTGAGGKRKHHDDSDGEDEHDEDD